MEKINLSKILEGDISRIDSVNVDDIALYEEGLSLRSLDIGLLNF